MGIGMMGMSKKCNLSCRIRGRRCWCVGTFLFFLLALDHLVWLLIFARPLTFWGFSNRSFKKCVFCVSFFVYSFFIGDYF